MTTTPRSRRTTSRRKGDDNERAILETAERLLAQTPLAEISVADLAAGAGISRSSFYFYFGSKDEVVLSLVDEAAAGLQTVVEAMTESVAQDPRGRLGEGIEATARLWRARNRAARPWPS